MGLLLCITGLEFDDVLMYGFFDKSRTYTTNNRPASLAASQYSSF